MSHNNVLERLPHHLRKLIIDQHYENYTWQDHSVWRFVMRQNVAFLKDKAHQSYINGLGKTGISIDQIPDIDTMNRILADIGWAAVTVDGFIPPAAFMEFQAYNVLVIAADIRPIDQLEYTPAPDIIHEAAGHAPIIADPEYAEYLRYFGEVGSKAFSSSADFALYEAIRHLSILKADPNTPVNDISKAEEHLAGLEASLGLPSEMALVRNLHWWTVEYGMIGDLKSPRIYGAGLLSSIGESANAMSDKVLKLPYSIDAVYYNFDITTQQPQLFVTPDFAHLTTVLDEFANRMALRKGGIEGLLKAIESANTATCVYSSGLQVTGTFTDYILHQNQAVYMFTKGPTMLSFANRKLDGHGKDYHSQGFGSPIGRIKNAIKPPRYLDDYDLMQLGVVVGKIVSLEFESGVTIHGKLLSTTRMQGNLLLLSFTDCTVRYQDRLLFDPSWGVFDMAVGESIVSAYGGPADADGFGLEYPVPAEKTHKIHYSVKQLELHQLYGQFRKIREGKSGYDQLPHIWERLKNDYPNDWLLPVEFNELLKSTKIVGLN
ncbi:MAG: aromatic amino acid hydroxylase, partial [Bacteroidales bacterium]|nr:aromatic amino acid hydroxylase [Bacteroidales bacterium]